MKARSLVLWAVRIGVIVVVTAAIAFVKPLSAGWAGFIGGFFVGGAVVLALMGHAIRHHWHWPPR